MVGNLLYIERMGNVELSGNMGCICKFMGTRRLNKWQVGSSSGNCALMMMAWMWMLFVFGD